MQYHVHGIFTGKEIGEKSKGHKDTRTQGHKVKRSKSQKSKSKTTKDESKLTSDFFLKG